MTSFTENTRPASYARHPKALLRQGMQLHHHFPSASFTHRQCATNISALSKFNKL